MMETETKLGGFYVLSDKNGIEVVKDVYIVSRYCQIRAVGLQIKQLDICHGKVLQYYNWMS